MPYRSEITKRDSHPEAPAIGTGAALGLFAALCCFGVYLLWAVIHYTPMLMDWFYGEAGR
jgi:hypothetical protein